MTLSVRRDPRRLASCMSCCGLWLVVRWRCASLGRWLWRVVRRLRGREQPRWSGTASSRTWGGSVWVYVEGRTRQQAAMSGLYQSFPTNRDRVQKLPQQQLDPLHPYPSNTTKAHTTYIHSPHLQSLEVFECLQPPLPTLSLLPKAAALSRQ